MYTVSERFEQYCSRPDRQIEVKAIVGSTTYDNSQVVEFDIEEGLLPGEDFTIGAAISSKLNITIRTTDTIATNAKVIPYVRFFNEELVDDVPTIVYTEWLAKGEFYIDNRNFQNNVWKFTCFDKLILSNQTYVSALTYPVEMSSVMDEIAGQLGVTLDASVMIDSSYMIPYKDEDITIHDMISFIAMAHCASAKMTNDGKLAFVVFAPGATATTILASEYMRAAQTNPAKQYTKIILTYNTDGETLTVGTGDADHTLELYNTFMDDAILDDVFAILNGFVYVPMSMEWRGRPYLECGDVLTITNRDTTTFTTTMMVSKESFKGGLKATATSPSYSAQRSEFDYKGSLKRLLRSAGGGLQEDTPYYGVTIGRANGLKIEKSDGKSKVVLNSDVLKWQVEQAGVMIDRLYFDAVEGDLKYNGKFGVDAIEALKADINVIINNTFVTEVLTANKAVIADLTVDRLSSSDKVERYKLLASDPLRKAPVGYIKINDQHIDLIDAQYVGDVGGVEQTEQAVNRNGDPAYWLDAAMSAVTFDVTDWPVLQFVYNEYVKLQIFHRWNEATGTFNPVIRMGAGNPAGNGITEIEKKTDGWYVTYIATGAGELDAGTPVSIALTDNGPFITPYDLEGITFTASGFSVEYSGTAYTWGWTKDVSGKITQLSIDGRTIPVTWGG